MTTTLRPLGLGELMDRAIGFWRAHWKPLFQLMVAFQLVQLIVLKAAQLAARTLFPLFSTGAGAVELMKGQPEAALPQLLGFTALMAAAVLAALFISQVAGVATTHYAWSRLTGAGQPGPGQAFRHAAARLAITAGAFALSLAWSTLVALLLLLPGSLLLAGAGVLAAREAPGAALATGIAGGLVLTLGLLLLVLWFVIRFVLLSQVIASEPVGPLGAFRRTGALSSGRVATGPGGLVKLRLTVLITIIGGILLLVSLVMTAPTFVIGAFYGVTFQPGQGPDDLVPAAILVPVELLQTLGGSLVAPLYVVFQVLFYGDMRARREGLDLELALREPAP